MDKMLNIPKIRYLLTQNVTIWGHLLTRNVAIWGNTEQSAKPHSSRRAGSVSGEAKRALNPKVNLLKSLSTFGDNNQKKNA